MRYLLDTHVFLWMAAEPDRLSSDARKNILDPENLLYVSIVSLWEMQIKHQMGKLALDVSITDIWEQFQEENDLILLNLCVSHIWKLGQLCDYHKDPFDRLLIAQAQCEDMALISADNAITHYDVRVAW